MKKYLVFGIMGALALGFTACSSEEEVAVNPTFDGNSVKAEFSLNIPGNYVATRQQKAITQDESAFRGIELTDLFIAPYATGTQADNNPVKATDEKVGTITLTAGVTGFDHQNAQDKWYNNVTVPVGTNAFLVYAEAKKGSSATDKANGSLTMSATDPFADLAALRFQLKPIAADLNIATAGKAITDALTALAATEGVPTADGTACAWSAVDAADNEFYADLYAVFAGLTAGSKTDVLAFLKDQLKPAVAAIQNSGDATNGIDVKVKAAVDVAIAAVEAADDFTATAGVPDGAAVLKCEAGTFSYVTTDFITGAKWGQNTYTFPAALWYRANTGIRAANEIKSNTVGTQTWPAFITAWTDYKKVKASTQSVALVNPLQYAVANFETKIKFAAANLVVTKKVVTDYTTTPETVTEETVESVDVTKLTLNGILVGDQANVDWQFKPASDATAAVIYDTDLIKTSFDNTDYQTAAQTLVLETPATTKQVNVALEFINGTGAAFLGKDGIVPAGAKFYLIGQLSLDPKNWSVETTGDKQLIFQQDYKTIAQFLINKLQGTAYNTIPDLRSPKLEFGLSVDLKWEQGYTFDIAVGTAD